MTLYWHDYETFGIDPARDRPAQFAGIRTDEQLNLTGEPLLIYCRPARDMLPQPESCLITGITPQHADRHGVPEAEFIGRIHRELSHPGTCGVGYNSIRFDDEFTRHTLYRNFYDPYSREWQHGCSRWDIIDMVRAAYALRPDGIDWPIEDGRPSFRLEKLTRANGIEHEAAHDALSDVLATIALARLVRQKQPKLYDYCYRARDKRLILQQLDIDGLVPVLHVSSMYPVEYCSTALVVPLARHPVNKNEIVVYDLRHDPAPLIELGAEQIRERLFTRRELLPENIARINIKTIHVNKCPVVASMKLLTPEIALRLKIDIEQSLAHLESIRAAAGLSAKLAQVYGKRQDAERIDPDLALYSGGFFSEQDRSAIERVRLSDPGALGSIDFGFVDSRLPEMLFRYRARNYPETLNDSERARWDEYRIRRLTEGGGSITLSGYLEKIAGLRESAPASILDSLEAWGKGLV